MIKHILELFCLRTPTKDEIDTYNRLLREKEEAHYRRVGTYDYEFNVVALLMGLLPVVAVLYYALNIDKMQGELTFFRVIGLSVLPMLGIWLIFNFVWERLSLSFRLRLIGWVKETHLYKYILSPLFVFVTSLIEVVIKVVINIIIKLALIIIVVVFCSFIIFHSPAPVVLFLGLGWVGPTIGVLSLVYGVFGASCNKTGIE